MTEDMESHEAEPNVFGPITTDAEGFTVTPQQLIGSGDTVAAVVRYSGTGKVSGKHLDLKVVHVWDLRDPKLARFRQFHRYDYVR